MLDDSQLFGNHPVNQKYQAFKQSLESGVSKGKIHQLDAITHLNALRDMAIEQRHDDASKYIEESSRKLKLHTLGM